MYKNKKIIHIVASGPNGEIGGNNKLLWHIPEDLRFFKVTTLGHVVLMGRKTVESLPKPLQRRITLPLGKIKHGYENLDDLLGGAQEFSNRLKTDCIYIAGGASLYEQTKDIVDELLITEVIHKDKFPHADTFYNKPENFVLKEVSDYKTHNNLTYRFTKWLKDNG